MLELVTLCNLFHLLYQIEQLGGSPRKSIADRPAQLNMVSNPLADGVDPYHATPDSPVPEPLEFEVSQHINVFCCPLFSGEVRIFDVLLEIKFLDLRKQIGLLEESSESA